MDPLTLILTALGAGATAGTKEVTSNALKDAYTGLKTLIQREFAGKSSAKLALTEYENDPETWAVPLKKILAQTQVDQDSEIIEAAQRVMAQVNPQQAAMGKYNVQITGNIQGFAQGDYQHVTMNFRNEPEEK